MKKNINMKKAFLLSLFLCASLSRVSAVNYKAQVATEGDRGLALAWTLPMNSNSDVYVSDITHDDEGNVYICGSYKKNLLINPDVSFPVYKYNSGNNGYLMKYTKEGKLLWKHDFSSDNTFFNPCFFPIHNGQLVMYAFAQTDTLDLYMDKEVLSRHNPKNDHNQELFIKFDIQTGKKLDVESVTNTFLYSYTSDSEGNLYLLADYKKGCQGLNDGRLHSVLPHEGAESYYVARIDTSFRLNGEFVIGSSCSTPDVYDYGHGYKLIATQKDTLFIRAGFKTDSVNVSPDAGHPVYAKLDRSNSEKQCVFAKYLLSGSQLRLLNFKSAVDSICPEWILSNRNGKRTASVCLDGRTYTYMDVHSDLSSQYRTDVPYLPAGLWSLNPQYIYDDADNFILTPYYKVRKYSQKVSNFVFSQPANAVYRDVLAKYLPDNTFCWAIGFAYYDLAAYNVAPSDGSVYVGGTNQFFYSSTENMDWNPDSSHNGLLPNVTAAAVARYVETYRVKLDTALHCTVSLPDTFIWHGQTCSVRVTADKDYAVDSVFANGQLLSGAGSDTYLIPNVTAPVRVRAVAKPANGVAQQAANQVRIYPNPTQGVLSVVGISYGHYEVLDVSGRVLLKGPKGAGMINVGGLPAGTYLLKLYAGNKTVTKEIIKQ